MRSSKIFPKMDLRNKVLYHILLLILSVSEGATLLCDSPQYMELEKNGIISCLIEEHYFGIYWYNSTDSTNNTPMLSMENSILGGDIFPSDEIYLLENGSLSITHVTSQHEHTYRVVLIVDKENGILERRDIVVTVFAKPQQNYPLISTCGKSRGCIVSARVTNNLKCSVNGTRPAVLLKWFLSTSSEEIELRTNDSMSSKSNRYFTVSDVRVSVNSTALLVCKSLQPLRLMQYEESYILIEKESNSNISFIEKTSLSTELGSRRILSCPTKGATFIKWEKQLDSRKFQTIALSIARKTAYSRVFVSNYEIDQNGTLITNVVTSGDEGVFICLYDKGDIIERKSFNTSVFADPNPAFPVVEGCKQTRHCVLHVKNQQRLNCSLFGIRPLVELEWAELTETENNYFMFSNHRHFVQSNDNGTFNVYVGAELTFLTPLPKNVTVVCKTRSFSDTLSTSIDIIYVNDHSGPLTSPDPVPNERMNKMHFLWIAMFFIILLFVTVTVIGYKCSKLRNNNKNRAPFQSQEVTPMFGFEPAETGDVEEVVVKEQEMSTRGDPNESVYPTQTSQNRRIHDMFVQQLMTKYQMQYEAIRPIPYIHDKIYRVNNLFVENAIESIPLSVNYKETGKNEKIKNYHELLKHNTAQADRTIVQGEPGYGKSTLALQMAYDWCTRQINSPLRNTDILIMIRLRQLYNITSIYKAIKLLLLPRDTVITEIEIERILKTCSSAVIILDGFDEYPDQDEQNLTDTHRIIKGEMFQQFLVVLFTRPSFLPTGIPPRSKNTRLIGFDIKLQQDYILKAVTNSAEVSEKIRSRLKANPVLGDLCQIPLLFVMFAHMSNETKEFHEINSVTTFFRYVIKCFHSHFHNKLKEKNVKVTHSFENDHKNLDEVSFEVLTRNKRIMWRRQELRDRLGDDLLNYYKNLGILFEEEVFDFELTEYKIEVRFYHKLFCEWFAAHHLSKLAEDLELSKLKRVLRKLDLFELHYVFRFACGLNSNASRKIIKYLNSVKNGENFAILCILEQTGRFSNIADSVQSLCSNEILLHHDDNRVLQRSIIQMMIIASRNEISISSLWLRNCFKAVDLSRECLELTTKMHVPKLETLKKIHIYSEGSKIPVDETLGCIKYAIMCTKVQELCFMGTYFIPNVYPRQTRTVDEKERGNIE